MCLKMPNDPSLACWALFFLGPFVDVKQQSRKEEGGPDCRPVQEPAGSLHTSDCRARVLLSTSDQGRIRQMPMGITCLPYD